MRLTKVILCSFFYCIFLVASQFIPAPCYLCLSLLPHYIILSVCLSACLCLTSFNNLYLNNSSKRNKDIQIKRDLRKEVKVCNIKHHISFLAVISPFTSSWSDHEHPTLGKYNGSRHSTPLAHTRLRLGTSPTCVEVGRWYVAVKNRTLLWQTQKKRKEVY